MEDELLSSLWIWLAKGLGYLRGRNGIGAYLTIGLTADGTDGRGLQKVYLGQTLAPYSRRVGTSTYLERLGGFPLRTTK